MDLGQINAKDAEQYGSYIKRRHSTCLVFVRGRGN